MLLGFKAETSRAYSSEGDDGDNNNNDDAMVLARVKVNHRRVYSCILVKVCVVAMATGLVKNKA